MNLAALIRRVRLLASDTEQPYFWGDEDIADWLNEAQAEAAIRGRLLRATPDSAPALCEYGMGAGEASVTLHPALYELSRIDWVQGGRRTPVKLVSREWLDRTEPEWRDMPQDRPAYAAQDVSALQLAPAPAAEGTLLTEGYRLPTSTMTADGDEPEIHPALHIHLVQWALHVGYSIPDAEAFNPEKSLRAEAAFERVFGARPDSDMRMSTRHDEPQSIVAWL